MVHAQSPKHKIGIFHAFFKNKGGAEKLIFDIRKHYNADLYTGAIRFDSFNPSFNDTFSRLLFDPKFKLTYLAQDAKIPIVLHLKRIFYFLFSPKIRLLARCNLVIFSGNVFFVAKRLRHKTVKLVTYCHTPPRPFTDQLENSVRKLPPLIRPLYRLTGRIVRMLYRSELGSMDLVISNSLNIQNRLRKYIGIESTVLYPAVDTHRFQYITTGDYFLSHSRLEEIKRIPLILEAFAQMPDQKLIITSSGPLERWIVEQITTRNLHNITYEGIVTDVRLAELVGKCRTGIVIPVDEDAGITQVELMAAGKPVIGVREGGLVESVIDGETGILIPANPTTQDLIDAVRSMTVQKALSLKDQSAKHAAQFSQDEFFRKFDVLLEPLLTSSLDS